MSKQNATHQTVRLSRGNHGSSEEGVCVMELASMLAGEPFSDAPDSVCPVVAAFMRTYNDGVDNSCRQDLYCFAAGAVGTADDGRLDSRRELCRQLVRSDPAPAWLRIVQRLRLGLWSDVAVASPAARTLASHPERHAAALTFLDALVGTDGFDLELDAFGAGATAPGAAGRS